MNPQERSEFALTAPTRFIEAEGRKLAYRSVGQGPPMILCNRFRGILDSWDYAFIDPLAKTFQVITFDYAGLGRSTGTPHSDILGMAQDARAIADGLHLEKFVLGGWSMGGMAAQTLMTEHLDRVSHLILIGTTPPGQNPHPAEQLFYERALKPSNDLADEEILFFEPKSETSRKAAKRSHDRLAERTQDLDIPMTAEQWASMVAASKTFRMDKYNARPKLKSMQMPILVISGDHDLVFPVENWYALNREIPAMQLIVFPHSGHGVQHEYPEATSQYITTFVQTTS